MDTVTSPRVVMTVVLGLVVITLALVIGSIILVVHGDNVPDSIWTLAGGGLGGLTALLASTRSVQAQPPTPPAPPVV